MKHGRDSDFGAPVTVDDPPTDSTVVFKDVPNIFKQLQSLSSAADQA
jgi:hypothetical protein